MEQDYSRILGRILTTVLVVVVALIVLSSAGSSFFDNLRVPAGYAMYVVRRPILGQQKFVGVYEGPGGTGMSYRVRGTLVSVTPYTFGEDFADSNRALAKDKTPVHLYASIVWRVRASAVQDFMENYGGLTISSADADALAETAYNRFVREPFRTVARAEIARHSGLAINHSLVPISEAIAKRTTDLLKNTPFEILDVVVTQASLPENVMNQVALTVGQQQLAEQKITEQEIARTRRDVEELKGKAEAAYSEALALEQRKALELINGAYNDRYIRYMAADSMNSASIIYVPMAFNGEPLPEKASANPPSSPTP